MCVHGFLLIVNVMCLAALSCECEFDPWNLHGMKERIDSLKLSSTTLCMNAPTKKDW